MFLPLLARVFTPSKTLPEKEKLSWFTRGGRERRKIHGYKPGNNPQQVAVAKPSFKGIETSTDDSGRREVRGTSILYTGCNVRPWQALMPGLVLGLKVQTFSCALPSNCKDTGNKDGITHLFVSK